MYDDVPDDGLDEALASACALAEATVVEPSKKTFIDLCVSSTDSYVWNEEFFTQAQRDSLWSPSSWKSMELIVHDILPDIDGRRIAMLLEQLGTTRKSTGLSLISLHRRDNTAEQLVLPGALLPQSCRSHWIYWDGQWGGRIWRCPWSTCTHHPRMYVCLKLLSM